jgi:hypothetical protein
MRSLSELFFDKGPDWFLGTGILIWILVLVGIAMIIVAAIVPAETWAFWTGIAVFGAVSLIGAALLSAVLFWRTRLANSLNSAIGYANACNQLVHIVSASDMKEFIDKNPENKNLFEFCDQRMTVIGAPTPKEIYTYSGLEYLYHRNRRLSFLDAIYASYCAEMIHSIEVVSYKYFEMIQDSKTEEGVNNVEFLLKRIDLVNVNIVTACGSIKGSKAPIFGICVYHPETSSIFVFLRGTLTIDEWKKDFKFQQSIHPMRQIPDTWKCKLSNVQVHSGFLEMSEKIIQDIVDAVKAIYHPKLLVIAGHSLGGAVASLTSFRVSHLFPEIPVCCYTFGKPRVGNIEYMKCYNAKSNLRMIRFENEEDVVPNLPWPVTPNLSNPDQPLVYVQEGESITFTKNIGSLGLNHSITMYQKFLKALLK